MFFKDRNIVVGITGGIAAYKSAELVRRLVKKGARVHCIMTRAAQEFVTPLTFRTLSQNPVLTELFAEPRQWNVEHVAIADLADLFMVVPATANILGKIRHGIADDFLSTAVMATRAPVLLAPAMNVNMYCNRITQDNLQALTQLGYHVVSPASGDLACGYEGQGRLAELEDILDLAEELLVGEKPLEGVKVVVTAGPTREPLDPVRYITNHSSGKMGYALAKMAHLCGAKVTLISGPVAERPSSGIDLIRVGSAREMYEKILQEYDEARIVIKCAAVADYRPKEKSKEKIKKKECDLVLQLERNPDILATLGQNKGKRILVGFAAETSDVLQYASEKARRKNLDLIVANDLTRAGAGFACDTNIVSLVYPNGEVENLSLMSKDEVAWRVIQEIIRIKQNKE
jgi:phosphopantothenoylcysteine decarboxylase/phosphopantothenate--cysteine ligase